jgi:hypothetical protein
MRVFIAVLVLIFSFQSWSKADDMSEFEIEGISIGDSLLNHFNKSLIDSEKTFPSWLSKKFTRFVSFENLKTYDAILIYFEDNGDYVISSISAVVKFQNTIDGCYKKKATIIKEFKNTFSNYEIQSYKSDHQQDKTGKSKNDITDFNFSSGASSRIICTDWSNEMNLEDELRVILSSKEYTYFITNVAYK